MQIESTGIASIEGRIGRVMEPIAQAQSTIDLRSNSGIPDKLERPPQALIREAMLTEEGPSPSEF